MFNVFARAIILFALVFLVIRMMGKRQVGELQPTEFVVALMAADIATVPMGNLDVPLLWGVIGIAVLLLAQIIVSLLSLKSVTMRRVLCGEPSVVISHGRVCEKVLASQRYNVNDLLEQLRSKGVFDISSVEYALLETNGELSVLQKSQFLPASRGDISAPEYPQELSYLLVSDGKIIKDSLSHINRTEKWLNKKLAENGTSVKSALVVQYRTDGTLFIQKKEDV